MAIHCVEESSLLDDSTATRLASIIREAALYSIEYWVEAKEQKEDIEENVDRVIYRFVSCLLAIGGAEMLPSSLMQKCSPLLLQVFQREIIGGNSSVACLLLPNLSVLPSMIILSETNEPSEGVRLSQPQVVAYLDGECAGEGILCVAERQVTWICRSSGLGFSLTYPSIILHAVSTDLSTFPHECIYVLVDASKSERCRRQTVPFFTAAEAQNVQDLKLADEELNHENDASDNDDDEEGKNVVIRFVPSDLGVLNQIYTEMCNCQELNPDENDDFSDEDGDMVVDENADAMVSGDGWYTAENVGFFFNLHIFMLTRPYFHTTICLHRVILHDPL
ncbi:Nucleotide-sensitive chloride conductance regulator [Trichostrongylus colubriformis]|uniref:Methylosome subunit pICln n=1 Tax=Trichostrongylus colubriformis TaxID=6319 RepID=A0AAN8IUT9_TRICO